MSGQILPAAAPLPSSTLPPEKVAKIWQSAKDFEAMALGQLLAPMFDTVDTAHSTFGGGDAEATWQSMLVDAIGKQMAAHGGFGLAQPIYAAMLRAQEGRAQQAPAQQGPAQQGSAQAGPAHAVPGQPSLRHAAQQPGKTP